jgi:hypothetical protein
MISNEIIEEYLYDILGMNFVFECVTENEYHTFKSFGCEALNVFYNISDDTFTYNYFFAIRIGFQDKIKDNDIKVWLRKKKLEKVWE